jgi:hypothetical protein
MVAGITLHRSCAALVRFNVLYACREVETFSVTTTVFVSGKGLLNILLLVTAPMKSCGQQTLKLHAFKPVEALTLQINSLKPCTESWWMEYNPNVISRFL